MTTSVYVQRVCALLLASGALTACSDSTPVGAIECIGERIRCGPTDAQLDPELRAIEQPSEHVSSTDLEILMPASHARPFPEVLDERVLLTADLHGDLWSVSSQDSRVMLAKLDRNGSTVEELAVHPPKGTREPDDLHAVAAELDGSGRSRTTVTVNWSRGCDGGEARDPSDCEFRELLVFDDFANAPHRIDVGFDEPWDVEANKSGQWLMYGNSPRIDKLDTHANLVWRQTGLSARDSQLRPWIIRGALQAENQLSVLVTFEPGVRFQNELWLLNSTGDIETRRPIGWSGEYPTEYAIDARGRDVITGTSTEGDLILMRISKGGSAEGNVIAREEFRTLQTDGFAVDSVGAAYVVTTAGGREFYQWRALLCRLSDAGRVRCFTLGDISVSEIRSLVDAFVVPEPGVVYVRSGSDLRRYELPEE